MPRRGSVPRAALCGLFALALAGPTAAFEPPAIEWKKTFPGSSWTEKVRPARDGGFVLVVTGPHSGEFLVIRTDGQGTTLWERAYGPEQLLLQDLVGNIFSVLETNDAGFLLCSDGFDLIKLDRGGDLIWAKSLWLGESSTCPSRRMYEMEDGGYILPVQRRSKDGGFLRADMVRVDSDGNVIWQKPFASTDDSRTVLGFRDMERTRDGSFVMTGVFRSPVPWDADEPWKLWLLKTDGEGNLLWERTWTAGNPGLVDGAAPVDDGQSVCEMSDGGYMVAGWTREPCNPGSDSHRTNALLVKTDPEGRVTWTYTEQHQQEGRCDEDGFGIVLEKAGGGCLVFGVRGLHLNEELGIYKSEVYLVGFDSTGERLWEKVLESSPKILGGNAQQISFEETPDGGYIVGFVGGTEGEEGVSGFHVIKLAPLSQPAAPFLRGRADGDGDLNLTDAICVLAYLFDPEGGACKQSVPACLDAADANDDGKVNITDPISVLLHLFAGAGALPAPFASCGPDDTADDLGCVAFDGCR